MNPSAAFSLQGLSFRYGSGPAPALDGLTAEIPAGQITAILGPNGSGKSTLLHVLLGLLEPQEGELHVFGKRQGAYTRRQFSRLLGLVPQDEHVTFDLSVFEYALLGRAPYLDLLERPNEADRAVVRAALDTVGIAPLARRAVPSLSGGEKQLATTSRALAQEPRVLLMDEPTSHLDLANVRRILRVLGELRAGGRTIIWTTHDPNAATAVADRVLLMRGGRLLAQGPTHEVITSEQLSATYGVPVDVVQMRGRPLVLSHDLG